MTRSSDRPSLIGRIFSMLTFVERHELPSVVTAFFLFFCVLGGYFAVRPVRETLGTILGRDRVTNLWLATWIASLAIVPLYGAVVAKIRRSIFLPLIYGFVAVALAIVGGVMQVQRQSVAVAQFFYVFISVLSLFLVSVFWSFLVELFDSGQAKRLFPVIAAGGTAGALVGPLFTDFTARTIGNAGILFVGAAAKLIIKRGIARWAETLLLESHLSCAHRTWWELLGMSLYWRLRTPFSISNNCGWSRLRSRIRRRARASLRGSIGLCRASRSWRSSSSPAGSLRVWVWWFSLRLFR